MTRPFKFNSEKAIQAVAFLLRRERGHRMNYMRLLKVLYFAERKSSLNPGSRSREAGFWPCSADRCWRTFFRLFTAPIMQSPGGRVFCRLTVINWR